jgi:hypothetical protein
LRLQGGSSRRHFNRLRHRARIQGEVGDDVLVNVTCTYTDLGGLCPIA